MLRIEDFEVYQDEMVELLKRLAAIESPSTDKAAVDRLGAVIRAEAERLGAVVDLGVSNQAEAQAKRGDQLVARWDEKDGAAVPPPKGILLLCHMDTVYELGWLEKHPLRFEDDQEGGRRLYGPGVVDMKAGIVILLTVMKVLQKKGEMPRRRVTALFTSDEEVGSATSRGLIEALAREAELVLCLEAGMANGGLKTARKGTGEMVIETRGKAAHAGVDHEKGVNAIEELSHHIQSAQALTDYTSGTTASVGKVSGGTRTNVVPDEARAVVDLRVPNRAEAERIERWAQALQPALQGAEVRARVKFDRPPMPRDALMAKTFARAEEIAAQLGMTLKEGSTGGGSDANFVAALGVPVLDGLGAIGGSAHSEGEYLLVKSLAERAALLSGILTEW